MDYDKLLNISVELGCQLMSSGAEIYRVEESIRRLLQAYGLECAEVFAIPNCVIVSVTTPEGHPITRMRRIGGHGTDIELLERCNDLCRQLCVRRPPVEEAQAQVASLSDCTPRYAPWQVLLGYGVVPTFFSPLFGGGISDCISAMIGGLAVGFCLLYAHRFLGANGFFRTAICSAVASMLSLLLVRLGLGQSVDTVTISVLMVLVPGVALTNAMREIMAGDIISGLSRAADAILTAAAIAIGAAMGLAIGWRF
ncbi:threonine/serine exporter family protein [Flintibacter muris]|uniref:threonine/serine exporter family protein n=1 Tax=Flintibacter muris TaxID=2941327 RepID=UPI002040DE32|nr:threonine/serine exporter family protein [Flintibacter muris]